MAAIEPKVAPVLIKLQDHLKKDLSGKDDDLFSSRSFLTLRNELVLTWSESQKCLFSCKINQEGEASQEQNLNIQVANYLSLAKYLQQFGNNSLVFS